jgi:hypothetical protein
MSLHTGLDQIREPEMPHFSIGGILGRSLWIVLWNFVSFVLMSIVAAIPLIAYVTGLAYFRFEWRLSADVQVIYRAFLGRDLIYRQLFDAGLAYARFQAPTPGGYLLSVILWLLLFVACTVPPAALAQRGFQSMLGRRASFGNCVTLAFAALPRVIVFAVLLFLAYGILAAVLGYLFDEAAGPTLPMVPTFILALIAIAATMFLSTVWWLGIPILMIEWAGPILALHRSWKLTQGARWQIAAILVLLAISIALIELVLARLLPLDTDSDSARILTFVLYALSALSGMFVYFTAAVAAAVGYFHLVGEKEGILALDRPFA